MMLKEGAPSRKRKAPQEVTSNACTECRRKRAKVKLIAISLTDEALWALT